MLQRTLKQIRRTCEGVPVTIAAAKKQEPLFKKYLGENFELSTEPCRRNTFPAIVLAAAYLHDVKDVDAEEAVVVCPVDPYVDDDFFAQFPLLAAQLATDAPLVLMGIEPTYPSEKYGYIKPEQKDGVWGFAFTEKPTKEKAEEYIAAGALWNGGVFAYKLSYVLSKSQELLGSSDYETLFNGYSELKKISFDYAVVEQENSLEVLRYSGTWKDLGTWNTLTEAMEESIIGDGRMNENCSNTHIINELGIPILAMGTKDMVISASAEGILVSDKEQSSYIKPFVDAIDQQIMFAEKSWGSYRVLDVEEDSMTVKVTLNPGHHMNYHSHEKRDEVWTVVSGTGTTIVDGMEQPVKPGDVVTMSAGCKHTVIAGENGLQLMEVQLGDAISVADKKKYEWPL